MRGSFCTPRAISGVTTLAFDRAVLYGIVAFPVLVLSTKKWGSSFLKNVSDFFRNLVLK